jgi:hypothetical protein
MTSTRSSMPRLSKRRKSVCLFIACLFYRYKLSPYSAPQWPYNGKRYIMMFPPLPTPPQQQSPHIAHPGPPAPMPPPTFEENSDPAAQAAQAAARGYVYAYPPYGYPGQVCLFLTHLGLSPILLVSLAHDGWYASSARPHAALHATYPIPVHATSKRFVLNYLFGLL